MSGCYTKTGTDSLSFPNFHFLQLLQIEARQDELPLHQGVRRDVESRNDDVQDDNCPIFFGAQNQCLTGSAAS